MENIDAPDVLPVILGGDIGAYSLARAFHEAYGIVPLVLSQAACHMCGDSSILVNRVVPHLERPAVLLSTLANTAECFSDRPLLLLGCGDWYVRLIVENRAVLEKSFIIPYIGEDLLNRLTEKDRFYELCAEVGVPAPRTVVFDASADGDDPAAVILPFPFPVVAKPASSAAYHYADFPGKQKVFFLRDAAELRATLAAVQSSRYEGKFLIQEMIPGDDTSMRILTTYSDQNGKVRFTSFGQTLLEDMRPMGVGNPLAIVSRTDETIVAEAARLLEAVGYTGMAYGRPRVGPTPARRAHDSPGRVALHRGAQGHPARLHPRRRPTSGGAGAVRAGPRCRPAGLPGREEPASAPVSARFRVPPMEDLPGRHGR